MTEFPQPGIDTTVYQPTGFRRALLWFLSLLYRIWAASIRVEIDPRSRAAATFHEEPVVIIMWHSTLFMAPIAYRRFRMARPVYALISASRDGGSLAYLFEKIGIGSVRGSSSRFGREAFGHLVKCSLEGNDITITPDGPRGPAYVMKRGVVLAARRTRRQVLLVGLSFGLSWRLKSWDRFFVPLPFSRVRFEFELISQESIPPGDEGVDFLADRLSRLTGELAGRAAQAGSTAVNAGGNVARSPGKG